MRNYGSDQVLVSWNFIDFTEGFAEGSFLVFRRNSETWKQRANGLGGAIRLYNPDRSGEVDLTINPESQTHQKLIVAANIDRVLRSVQGAMQVTDRNTNEVFVLTGAYIKTEPDEQRATTPVDIAWTFAFTSINHIPNLSNRNAVGT